MTTIKVQKKTKRGRPPLSAAKKMQRSKAALNARMAQKALRAKIALLKANFKEKLKIAEQEAYQKRPKRKSLGARAQEYRFAAYVESWRQKVEKIGNLNYPEAAREQKIYGQLQMTVYIKSDGHLEKIEIRRSSGFPVLDEAAKRIVELGAPYAAFPDDIRKEVDILDITRTWTFTKEDSLTSRGLE